MKGRLLVSHDILDCATQAQVFVSTRPMFGVNEESISAVSPQNFQERGKSLFEICCSRNQAVPPFSPLIEVVVKTRILFYMKFDSGFPSLEILAVYWWFTYRDVLHTVPKNRRFMLILFNYFKTFHASQYHSMHASRVFFCSTVVYIQVLYVTWTLSPWTRRYQVASSIC